MTPPLSLTGAQWTVRPVDETAWNAARHHVPDVVARVMALRGFDPTAGWLTPSVDHLHDPHAMTSMGAAVDRLQRAVAEGQKLRVITDYDVDGTTSSLILQAALSLSGPGLQLDHHIPDRFREGYGFSPIAAEQAADDGVDLIVTADIGIRDHAAVAAARARGVDVLICDHHLPPGADVPGDATVLCPPQEACSYPNSHLAACGVSLKLAEALLAEHPKREPILRSLWKLAAIGTVADLVRLDTLENRALVAMGLEQLNVGRHAPGLQALLDVAGAKPGQIDEQTLGYQIGPRINAAGRMAHATHVIDLLTCRDPQRAQIMAKQLDALNRERRDVQASLVDRVLGEVGVDPDPFVLVAGPEADGFHRGVVGIVAARVKESTHRPTAVVSIQGAAAVGSVRSIPGVHAVRALDSAADLLVKYGGHPMAAGFTVPTEHLEALRRRLCDYVAEHTDDDTLVERHEADAVVDVRDLSRPLYDELRRLGPFGQGHREPLLMVSGATLSGLRTMGADGKHLKARLGGVDVVWWRQGELGPILAAGPVDLLGHLRMNHWRGRSTLQLVLTDARAAVEA